MRYAIEIEREDDGRWIADIPELPGVMVYGETPEQAIAAVEALALHVIAGRLERGEVAPSPSICFAAAALVPAE
jgi:predicted RNase H-like HicB family nuclease